MIRGVRGAICVETNTKNDIWQSAKKLVTKIFALNNFHSDKVSAIIFSMTKDLTAAFPTTGLRQIQEFNLVPLLDTVEPDVEGAMPMCLRVLILIDTNIEPEKICNVYLGEAQKLRPDLSQDAK